MKPTRQQQETVAAPKLNLIQDSKIMDIENILLLCSMFIKLTRYKDTLGLQCIHNITRSY